MSLLAVRKFRGEEELKRALERAWSRRLIGIAIGTLEATSRTEKNSLFLNVSLTAERFAELMQDRFSSCAREHLCEKECTASHRQRTSPVELGASLRRDSVKLKVPAGFELDELPPPASVESTYGTLKAVWTVENGEILFEQTLEIRNTTAPAAEFANVRNFFDKVAAALTAPVTFVKQ